MKNSIINNLLNFDLKNIFWKKKEKINEETNQKIDDCIENISENKEEKEEKFEEIFNSNLISIKFFFEKIETKNEEIEKNYQEFILNNDYSPVFKLKLNNYTELLKAYFTYLEHEIKTIKEKWSIFEKEISELEGKIKNYENIFKENLEKYTNKL